MNIQLEVTEKQQQQLLALAAEFNKELEEVYFPKSATLQALKDAINAVLMVQEGFETLLKQSRAKVEVLCLSHERTAIRNLPWQIATEDYPLLAIAKSAGRELPAHQPSLGFPLKVLVMVASPEGVSRLAYEQEELQLLRAFSPLMAKGLAQVHFTDDGSLTNLEEKLRENRYHILHYTGHGVYQNEQGFLALEDPTTGKLSLTKSEEFNQVLAKVQRKGHRPDLVVLSACQTAQGVDAGDLSGVADTLLQGGVPAVIAMSASILDKSATIFAEELYSELSDGMPLPDAFQTARLEVRKWEKKKDLVKYGLAPGQWLIPQLLQTTQVMQLVDENAGRKTLDFKKGIKLVVGESTLVNLRVRPESYVFVGRRREKRIAMAQLADQQSILLRGQGGVGKTAMAEHLAIRLMAANQRVKVFTFSEKEPSGQSLLDQMTTYLSKEQGLVGITTDLAQIEKQTDKFLKLLEKVNEHCDPVFLFDNVESFQLFDEEQGQWVWNEKQHIDILELLQILHQQSPFPLIITGRYPIAEFTDLEICDLNEVPFADFFKKCHQMQIHELAKKLYSGEFTYYSLKYRQKDKPLTFEEVAGVLHKTFGGNYRALEFFDELYVQKGEEITQTLDQLTDLKNEAATKEIKKEVLIKMSENLIFKELLSYLNEEELDTLYLLAQFSIPVLPKAIEMQRESTDRTESLTKAVNLTLVEKQEGADERERYYVMPLVKELLGITKFAFDFDKKLAGDYHQYVFDNKLSENALTELSAAFEHYFGAKAIDELNRVGERLCSFYYEIQQFQLALTFGLQTEEVVGEETAGTIWNNIGLIYRIHGRLELAMSYLQKSLADDQERGDKKGEGTALNNISQIYDAKGDYETALQYLESSLKIRQEIGDRSGEGATLNNISQIYGVKGDYQTALQYLESSLEIRQEIGDRSGEGITLNNISQIYNAKGDYDTALQYLESSLKIQQEIGDRSGEGPTLNNLATVAHAKGDYETALQYLIQTLKIVQEIGDRSGEGATLNNISQIYDAKGDYKMALQYLESSLKIRQEIGDISGMAATMSNMGALLFEQEQYEEAIPLLLQAYQILNQIGSPNQEHPLNYLTATVDKIGKDRFKEIVKDLKDK